MFPIPATFVYESRGPGSTEYMERISENLKLGFLNLINLKLAE
jgi:hypothetical protein